MFGQSQPCLDDQGAITIDENRLVVRMHVEPVTLGNSEDILNLLAEIALQGTGFTTDCLLDYVLDEGFTEPIYLNASGVDPDAYYKGQPNAWGIYQVREWKRVLTVSGGPGKERRVQITETP